MILRSCEHCHQRIPSRIEICPYCRKDFIGKAHPMAETVAENAKVLEDARVSLEALQSDDPDRREEAITDLSRKGVVVVPQVLRLLGDPRTRYQASLLKLVGLLQDPQTISILKQHVRSSDEEIRASAIEALSRFKDPEAMKVLLDELGRAEPVAQAYIAHIISRFEASEAVKPLTKLLRHRNPEVVFHAAISLGYAGDASAGGALRRCLGHRQSVVRQAAKQALERLGMSARRWDRLLWILCFIGIAGGLLLWRFYS